MTENPASKGPDLSALRIAEEARDDGRRGTIWRIVAVAVFVVVLGIFGAVFLRGGTPVVEVVAARAAGDGGAPTLLNASGYVTPRRRATVAAKITARVVEMLADEGLNVREGQVLARLDDSDAQKRLATARAALDVARANVPVLEVSLANAERELARQQDLEREGVSSVQALDLARTTRDGLQAQLAAAREGVRQAQASLATAEQDVENCTVRAPFAGIVVSKDAQPGEMVSPVSAGSGYTRTGIATIVDMRSLEIEVDVNESYIARVLPDQKVVATLDAYPDWQIPCRVRTVIPTADRQKATVKVRISFEALDPRILPDMGVKVAFMGDERRPEQGPVRALVPREAVREAGGARVVFVYHEGTLERRAVSVGSPRGSELEITAGVSAGEQVVVRGPEGLHEGQRVKVKQ
jgi:RND family efflux transporter MFP subunit